MSGGDQLRHHVWASRNSRALEEKRLGHDMKVELPKQRPCWSLLVAVKLALRSGKMALLKGGA